VKTDIKHIAKQIESIIDSQLSANGGEIKKYKYSIEYAASVINRLIESTEHHNEWCIRDGHSPIELIKNEGYRHALLDLKQELTNYDDNFNDTFTKADTNE
jgi:hypothetical protein